MWEAGIFIIYLLVIVNAWHLLRINGAKLCAILRERPDRGHGIPASVNTVGRQEPLRQGRTNLAIEESLFYKFMSLGRRNDN